VFRNTPITKIKTPPIGRKWRIVLLRLLDFVAEDDVSADRVGFFAILDGHGGADVSEYCAKHLPIVIYALARFSVNNMKKIAAVPKTYSKGYARE